MSFVIPAIDLKDKKCVQLQGGDPNKVLFEREDPIQVAKEFSKSFGLLHLIDLDSALGTGDNSEIVREIANIAPVQVGGCAAALGDDTLQALHLRPQADGLDLRR